MSEKIIIKGARVHNLKNIDLEIPKNKFVVITGLSGSGKSSLAFDTIYAEGQRRYVESLSAYARQFLGLMDKPDVDSIDGLSPTIAIDQRSVSHNPRSTVGTVTEIYDYLRILFAKVGQPHCPNCGQEIFKQTLDQIVSRVAGLADGKQYLILAPVIIDQKGEHRHTLEEIKKSGYHQVRLDGRIYGLEEVLDMSIDKSKKHTLEIIINQPLAELDKSQLVELLKNALDLGNGFITLLDPVSAGELFCSQYYACRQCDFNLPLIEPRSFSFNSPQGACPNCTGLGTKLVIDPGLVIPNKKLSLAQGAIKPWLRIFANQKNKIKVLEKVADQHQFTVDQSVSELTDKQLRVIFYGTGSDLFEGVIPELEEKHRETDSDYVRKEIERYMRVLICPACRGKRLKPEMLAVTVADFSIADLVNLPTAELIEVFQEFSRTKNSQSLKKNKYVKKVLSDRDQKISRQIFKEIHDRLVNLNNVGLDYLTLDRPSTTLSGGESQRIRLATQISSLLTGIIYVLDEPSIGLHPRDNEKLIETLKKLRDLGNTIIVVEHDQTTIVSADAVIDMGPGAGENGGRIIAKGSPEELMKNKESLTGSYLSGQAFIEAPKKTRPGNKKSLIIRGAKAFNLKNIDVEIPLGKFICITGVSGSGKSTLMTDILAKALNHHFYRAKDLPAGHDKIEGLENIDKVVDIDQSPIGRTPRSNPATYTGVFTNIRDLFIEVPEARIKGYKAGMFSFNVKGGRCENCQGEGMVKIAMQFLQDVYVECEDCHGQRYNKKVLEIFYNGKNIADILNMTVEEARNFFRDVSVIYDKLNTLYEVGLGYIKLGQSATTLSGGEAQRIKLATELSRRATGKTLYILDEPTTGLHFEDIKRLLLVLNKLVDKGNTILVIEHNLDVIKSSDWIIDLGPEGGKDGGQLVFSGPPKDIVRVKQSYTGQYLKRII
ncbi:MAG TPA: excinuclease ABC subunit UvrA [Patescibacteria group bacterium]